METGINQKEHWITRVKAIHSKDIFVLARELDVISQENFVIASQVYPKDEGYDCLIYIKVKPEDKPRKEVIEQLEEEFNTIDRPTAKQLNFLKEHKFKIEPNLTKRDATKRIKEYLERLDNNKVKRVYTPREDY